MLNRFPGWALLASQHYNMATVMIYSETEKFGFIHVHKTAGTSLSEVLLDAVPDAREVLGRHARLCDITGHLSSEDWHDAYTFAFVRNPWDRLVSWYSMISANTNCFTSLNKGQPANWRYVAKYSTDFRSFVLNCDETVFENGYAKSFIFDQISYLEDENRDIAVSYVGKFETLSDDLAEIQKNLSFNISPIGHRNPSKRQRDYRPYYDDQTAGVVAKRFRRDIEAFGYNFD